MKYYECDMCGEIRHSTLTYNPFKDSEWACVEFNVNNKEIDWKYDKETDSYITHDTIATLRHYCPLCYERYCNLYRPFLPVGE